MSEKYLGEVSTPLLIKQIEENCTQKRSTLPIASIDELDNTYQYTGTTSGSLVHGYFYECVVASENPTTYGWQQVNIQPTAETPTASGTTFNNTTSGLQATNVQDAIDEVDGRVDNIEEKIPSTATSSNKLVDHDSLGTAAFKGFTPNVAPNNHNLVESNAVYNAITTALTSVYTPRGDLTCAELTSSLLIAANVGNIYEMSDAGTTSALFLQGAGQTIHVGDNVGIIQTGVSEYKFNLMANAFDMTDYQKKELTSAVEGQTTVEGALNALDTKEKDDIQDVYKVMGQNGAKNLAKPINSISYLDVTVVCDENGVLSLTGTASGSGGRLNIVSDSFVLKAGTYKVVHTSSDLTKYSSMVCHKKSDNTSLGYSLIDNGTIDNSHAQFTLASDTECFMGMNTYQGTNYGTSTGTKEYVMVVLVDDIDTTYQPYSKTNQQLTKETSGMLENIHNNGAVNLVPSKAESKTLHYITYTVGSDGVIDANGTSDVNTSDYIIFSNVTFKAGKYIILGTGTDNIRVQITNYPITSELAVAGKNNGVLTLNSDTAICMRVSQFNGQAINHVKIYPMMVDADFPLSGNNAVDYVPYAMSNQQITKAMPLNVGVNNKLISSLSRIITVDESTANPNLLNTLTGGNVKFAWGAIKLQNDAPHTIDNEVYVISYAENNISQVGNTAVIAQIAIARSGSGYDSTIYKRFYCYHSGTYKWSPWDIMVSASNLSYSASEINTGAKWIDGKTIYRKVYSELSMGTPSNSWQSWSVTLPSDVGLLINSSVLRNDKTYCADVCTKLNPTAGTVDYLNHTFNSSTNDIRLVIEYTKTT